MKILNLYAGLGGNRRLWGEEHEVTAVELEVKIANVYKNNFPNDNVIISDAHQYLLDHYKEYDFIWSSPPCQTHSKMAKATSRELNRYTDMGLYQEILFLDNFFKGKYVVENVKPYYTPLIRPTKEVGRHLFWSNFKIGNFKIDNIKGFIDKGTVADTKILKDWLDIQYEGNIYYKNNHCPAQVLRNCVHPKTGEYILDCAMNIIRSQNTTQITLF
jgi:DNA (cytosine-5)-methyltransferase 1